MLPELVYAVKLEFNAIQSLHQHLASGDILKVLHGPADEAVDVRHQGLPKLREAVFHLGRDDRIGLAVDQVVPLQVLEFG